MKSQLKIISVRPFAYCASHILKVLKKNEMYFFYNNYQLTSNNNFVEPISGALTKDFFSTGTTDSPFVSICAIVGKNGDGKSSLIELMVRMLNNFAHVYGFGKVTENLVYIEGVYGELYFSITENDIEHIYKICFEKDRGSNLNQISLYKDTSLKPCWSYEFDIIENRPIYSGRNNNFIESEHHFFSMVVNYSLYAFNTNDFEKEGGWRKEWDNRKTKESVYPIHWLDQLFHKNDGYQTPIVINPFRDEGKIDINNEQELTKQRMMSLFLTDDEDVSSFRWINDKQFAQWIEYELEAESKLERKTFYDFFRKHYYHNAYTVDHSAPALKEYYTDLRARIATNPNQLDEDFTLKIENDILLHLEKMHEFMQTDLFLRASKIFEIVKEDLKKERDSSENINRLSDIQIYTEQVRDIFSNANDILASEILERINTACSRIYELDAGINFNHFFQIVLVDHISKEWQKRIPYLQESIDRLNDIQLTLGRKAFDYLIYKTISIISKYPAYKNWYRFNTFQGYAVDGEMDWFTKKCYIDAIDSILKDDTHITFKLRQTLNLLNYDFYKQDKHDEGLYKDFVEQFRVKSASSTNRKASKEKKDYTNYYKNVVGLCMVEGRIESSRLIDFLPAPIFKTDSILVDKYNKELFYLSQLSSGERQMIGVISSIIYHLRNLNSIKSIQIKNLDNSTTDIYKYKHINIILEEIELYFHPEFQRQFINKLLRSIGKINLNEIDSLNFCFVTHSPFILSDIPKNNVLFLKEGKPTREMQENTFGANVHTLLQNSFFLHSVPIGDFAKEKINLLFSLLHKGETSIVKNNKREDIYSQILLVSEPFIRDQLLKLYNSLSKNSQIKDLAEEIYNLKKQIEQLKENQA